MVYRMIFNQTAYFGRGAIKEISGVARSHGFTKAFIVTDPVLLETDDVYCVLGVVMDETGETPQVLAIQAYFGEDAKAFLDGKMTFYGSSTYKLPKA